MAAILGCCFRVSFRRCLKASRAPISVTTRLGHVQVQRDLLGASLSVMLNIGYIMPRSGNYFRKAYASSHGVPGHRSDENTHPVFHSSATISQRKAAGSFGGGSPGGPRPDPRAARQVSCTNFTMPGWTTSSGTSDPKLPSPTRQSHFRLSLDSKTMQPAALNLLLHSGFSSQRHGFKARHTLAALDEKAVLAMSCILVHMCFVLPSFHHAFLHACMHSYIHDGRTDGRTDRQACRQACVIRSPQ